MKKITLSLLLFIAISICNAQNQGSITTKEIRPKAGIENHYVYQPPKNLSIPDKIQASVVYQSRQQFFIKTIRVDKVVNSYQFFFKAPDSTSVLIFSIATSNKIIPEKNNLVAEKKMILDNNNENGFVVSLFNKSGKRFPHEKLDVAALLNNPVTWPFNLKGPPNLVAIKWYEDSYKLYPAFKKENSYLDYLFLLYAENKVATQPKLLSYANQLLLTNDEENWANAIHIYSKLRMEEEIKAVKAKILIAFPNGNKAKENFWSSYYANTDKSEKAMLASINDFKNRFKDSSAKSIDIFYTEFLLTCIENNDTGTAFKYESLVTNKNQLAFRYDRTAWKLSGKEIDNPGKNLEIARRLSEKAIAISSFYLKDSVNMDEDVLNESKNFHYQSYDNYALVLHKLGQSDSAFYFQDLVSNQGKGLNTGGMERYAAYAEKVKGVEFTKQYIEPKLLTGINSPVMLKQLQGIYKKLNLPEDKFNRLQEMSRLLTKQKYEDGIIAKFGSLKAPDFLLKNMEGETVSLSDLKNKIVVLDFWATWCSPCKASFPAMQKLVNKYKDEKDVVFLFIDTWQNELPQKIRAEVSRYMQENKYSFNVLFDENKKVKNDYKVVRVPHKIIIDKNGNIIFEDEFSGFVISDEELTHDIVKTIDAAKQIPYNPNINNTKLPNPVFLHPKTKQ
jgi:thiol-disulfide isomerase/thioredoxin